MPVSIGMDQTDFDKNITEWLEYVEKYKAKWRSHLFDEVAILVNKFGAKRTGVVFLRSLRGKPAWTKRRDDWKRRW